LKINKWLKKETVNRKERSVSFCLSKIAENHEFEIFEQVLDTATTIKFAKQISAQPDLTSFTFESNIIQDEAAVCALLSNLKSFDKLENLNVRLNKLNLKIVDALCEGIMHKKELRVNKAIFIICLDRRPR
jgi:hypothetical protein